MGYIFQKANDGRTFNENPITSISIISICIIYVMYTYKYDDPSFIEYLISIPTYIAKGRYGLHLWINYNQGYERGICGGFDCTCPSCCYTDLKITTSDCNRFGFSGGKGLRHFSMKVCEKVKAKGTTSYNEVADELVAELTDPRCLDFEGKIEMAHPV